MSALEGERKGRKTYLGGIPDLLDNRANLLYRFRLDRLLHPVDLFKLPDIHLSHPVDNLVTKVFILGRERLFDKEPTQKPSQIGIYVAETLPPSCRLGVWLPPVELVPQPAVWRESLFGNHRTLPPLNQLPDEVVLNCRPRGGSQQCGHVGEIPRDLHGDLGQVVVLGSKRLDELVDSNLGNESICI